MYLVKKRSPWELWTQGLLVFFTEKSANTFHDTIGQVQYPCCGLGFINSPQLSSCITFKNDNRAGDSSNPPNRCILYCILRKCSSSQKLAIKKVMKKRKKRKCGFQISYSILANSHRCLINSTHTTSINAVAQIWIQCTCIGDCSFCLH